ncbi:hypothetical protein ENC_24470 [Enterobacter hormaechei]|nr:hypothetical protein ENC_24470 [Enterobacter hormaechei]
MLTVYCEKMTNTGLSAPIIGLIGIAIGAILGLATSYFTQRWQHKNAMQLEKQKTEVKLFTDHVLADLLKYIDTETDYIQRIYAIGNGVSVSSNDLFGTHRLELAKYNALLGVFKDDNLIKDFKKLLTYRDRLHEFPLKNDMGEVVTDSTIVLDEAVELASNIKANLFAHCSFNKPKK